MYGNCSVCKEIFIPVTGLEECPRYSEGGAIFPLMSDVDRNRSTKWFKWSTKKEQRNIKGNMKMVSLTVKEEIDGTIAELIDETIDLVYRFKKHTFNIQNQYLKYSQLRKGMSQNECMIHVDFSENYVCKLSSEIQSMHFGASQKQISLHTGVFYIGSDEKAHCFCTASDDLQHGPGAIWAHLNPILEKILAEHRIDTIHFFSDGPVTQYRQKANFYLFARKMLDRKILKASWNFFESGHGKGAPDGVGGAIKVSSTDFT
jgi:hypothetical protein